MCSCTKTLKLEFDNRDFLNSFTTSGVIGNSKGFVGNAIVTAYDTCHRKYRIFFNINSIIEDTTSPTLRNNVTINVSKVSDLNTNLLTTTFNTEVDPKGYFNLPNVYTSDNGSKFIVPSNGNNNQLILRIPK